VEEPTTAGAVPVTVEKLVKKRKTYKTASGFII
jgi:hypothetical protein